LIEVIVADAVHLFPNVILYQISSHIATTLVFDPSVNVFLIRGSGDGIGSSSQSSSFGSTHSGLTQSTLL
jgi:hypothetical protein